MKCLKASRVRSSSVILCALALAMAYAVPFSAQQPRPSPIAPVKPTLPSGSLSDGEKLIKPPPEAASLNARNRRATKPLPPLNEDQKILHLLNRAGFGPRPGDIRRVREMGIERYIEEQLTPEEVPDDTLSRPLLAISTLHLSIPETMQIFAPPPARATPTPTPTPTTAPSPTTTTTQTPATTATQTPATTATTSAAIPAPAINALPSITSTSSEAGKGEMSAMQNQNDPARVQGSMPQQKQAPERQPVVQQKAKPAPTPRRDPQQPLRELQQAKLLRAVFSEKQLHEVMVDFWINHFNVFGGKDSVRWMVSSYERDAIRPHALGKFKEMLVAVAQSPAMLYYLDNFLSRVEPPVKKDADGNPIPARRPGLNENYARELMELHTLGVDGGYTQQDVIEVARCFTGWSITTQPNSTFVFRPNIHDRGEKLVLNKRIPAGGGIEDGLRVLDMLVKHPSTARFISYKLSQRFVADDPPASLVDRAAAVFQSTEGDIREVVRSILFSPEFYSPLYYRNKVKSPLELAASAIRATGTSTDAASPLIQWIARMGEPLYLCQPPTGYSEDSSRWLSNATLLERMNFAVTLVSNKINGTRFDATRLVDFGVAKDRDKLLDRLIAVLVHSDLPDETRDNLESAVDESRAKKTPAKLNSQAEQKNNQQLIGGISALILGSREFQVK